jgi:hypothetical protein
MTSHMTNLLSHRRASGRVVAIGAALALLLPLGALQAHGEPLPSQQGKKFAAYRYGWYPIRHVDHFDHRLPKYWKRSGTGTVKTQKGMITLISSNRGNTTATLGKKKVWDRGRWEVRLRAKRFERGNTDYLATAELIPAGRRPYHCGARNIGFARFRPDGQTVTHYIRNLPNHQFTRSRTGIPLSNDYWHTYGVEVTPKRISWFMDGRVRATERRPQALSGVPLSLRLQLTAPSSTATMNRSRLQVDTVRYFSLKSKNKKSVKAPQPTRSTYGRAC